MAAPFVGNQDYRGYLNYLGTQGDKGASALLGYVGNDAKYDPNKLTSSDAINRNTQLYQQYQGLNAPPSAPKTLPSIYSGGGGGAAPAVYAPPLDIAAIQSQARQSAQNAVNPYYTLQLNDFLKGESIARSQHEQAFNLANEQAAENQALINKQTDESLGTTLGDLNTNLQSTLKGYDITKQRTIEDVGTNKANINNQADIFQTDSGQAANKARISQAKDLASKGLTGGLGAQQTQEAQTAHNTAEARQEDQFKEQRQQQDLFQNRTVEDLLRQGELATTQKGQQETSAKQAASQKKEGAALNTKQAQKQAKFDIDSYYAVHGETGGPMSIAEQQQRNTLEDARQKEIATQTQDYAKTAYNNFITGIADPAKRLAAAQQYGGSF